MRMGQALFLVLLLLCICILCAIFIIHKYVNAKIKIIANVILVFAFLALTSITFYYFYNTTHSPDKQVYYAAFEYFSCEKNQLYENECNEPLSNLEASKVKAEIEDVNKSIIDKTIKLAQLKANPEKTENPYSKIKNSLLQKPLFITPINDNYFIYKNSVCGLLEKSLYQIVGWVIDPPTYTVYIAVYKINNCPKINDIDKFPIITSNQFKELKDGYYWGKRPYDFLMDFTQKIIVVDNLNFSLNDLKKSKQSGAQENTKITDKEPADIQNIGSYGPDNIELYKSRASCFIVIYGKNNDKNQGVIFWNPRYPEWLVLYPNSLTAINAIQFSRSNQSKLIKENITNYVVILQNMTYATKGVYIDNKIVKLANVPISNLKEKLIDADNVIFHLQNSSGSSQHDFSFGLNGFQEATKAYESLCKDR